MFGFVVGTASLIGLFALFKTSHVRRWHHHPAMGHRGCGASRRGRERWFEEGGFGRAAAEVVKRRLRIDEDQEGIVDHALRDLRESGREYVSTLKDLRRELGGAFSGEVVDEAAIAATFTRHDEEMTRARRDVVSALKQIHGVLDPEQRRAASEWLAAADQPRWV
ncbi:MAG: Spy/CpxP family protein refolding chaperone [Myxococcota bacterium]